MIRRRDASYSVFVESLLDFPLNCLVELHEGYVSDVDEKEDECFPPVNVAVVEETYERD